MEDVWLNKNVTQQQNTEITSTNNVPFLSQEWRMFLRKLLRDVLKTLPNSILGQHQQPF